MLEIAIPHLPQRPLLRAAWDSAWSLALDPAEPNVGRGALFHDVFLPFWQRYALDALPTSPLHPLDRYYRSVAADGHLPGQIVAGDVVMEDPPGGGHKVPSFRPPLFSWAEWDTYEVTGDDSRFQRVFPILARHLNAYIKRRSLADKSCRATPAETGLPGLPRKGLHACIDTTAQQALDLEHLALMALHLDRVELAGKFGARYLEIKEAVNDSFWDEDVGAYCDRDGDGDSLGIVHAGGYWTFVANLATASRAAAMAEHLREFGFFKRRHPIPTLPARMKGYQPWGETCSGGVYPPVVYMVARGLERAGDPALAHEIALAHVEAVAGVLHETGRFWDRYAPDFLKHARGATALSPGWTGLSAITMLIEFVLGIRLNVPGGSITWRLFLDEDHGVDDLRFGSGRVSLRATRKKGAWEVRCFSTVALELVVMGRVATRILEVEARREVVEKFRD